MHCSSDILPWVLSAQDNLNYLHAFPLCFWLLSTFLHFSIFHDTYISFHFLAFVFSALCLGFCFVVVFFSCPFVLPFRTISFWWCHNAFSCLLLQFSLISTKSKLSLWFPHNLLPCSDHGLMQQQGIEKSAESRNSTSRNSMEINKIHQNYKNPKKLTPPTQKYKNQNQTWKQNYSLLEGTLDCIFWSRP